MKDICNNLISAIQEVENEYESARKQLGILDREVSDLLHFLELEESITQAKHLKVSKLLRETLKKRREVKNSFRKLQAITSKTDDLATELDKLINKKAEDEKYRVKELTDLLGEYI